MLQNHRNENTDLFGASLLSNYVPDNMAVVHEDGATPTDVIAPSSDALDLRSKKVEVESDSEPAFDSSLGSLFKRSIAQGMAAQLGQEEEPAAKGGPGGL